MTLVFLPILREYQEVVDVYDDELVKEWSEDILHDRHESGRGVGESEWHNPEFVVAISRAESSFLYVVRVDADLVIPRSQIYFREYLGAVDLVHQVVNT